MTWPTEIITKIELITPFEFLLITAAVNVFPDILEDPLIREGPLIIDELTLICPFCEYTYYSGTPLINTNEISMNHLKESHGFIHV